MTPKQKFYMAAIGKPTIPPPNLGGIPAELRAAPPLGRLATDTDDQRPRIDALGEDALPPEWDGSRGQQPEHLGDVRRG